LLVGDRQRTWGSGEAALNARSIPLRPTTSRRYPAPTSPSSSAVTSPSAGASWRVAARSKSGEHGPGANAGQVLPGTAPRER
jgi:hypothetical protein